jgi:hypothetical protein
MRVAEKKPNKQQRKAARLLAHGASFMDALTGAGYSRPQARKGLVRVLKSRGLVTALRQEIAKFPPEVRANLVRLRLLQNVIEGSDVATKSARLLGLDKEVHMWQDELQEKTLIIQAPVGWNPSREGPRRVEPALPPSEAEFPDYD